MLAWAIFADVLAGARFEWDGRRLALGVDRYLDVGIRTDPLTAIMLVVVTTVTLLVQLYLQGYMVASVDDEHAGQGGHAVRLDPMALPLVALAVPSVVDGLVNGVAWLTAASGTAVSRLQTGRPPTYMLAIFVGLAVIAVATVVPSPINGGAP